MTGKPTIRPASESDKAEIWNILEPVVRAGETYPLPRNWSREEALDYWFSLQHRVFVAEDNGVVLGTYYLRANNLGGGSHVANCGYMVGAEARGRGVARQMCAHSLAVGAELGFAAMQFNFVVASNAGAVHLWTDMGFETVGRLPGVFNHPREGMVDALVMFRTL